MNYTAYFSINFGTIYGCYVYETKEEAIKAIQEIAEGNLPAGKADAYIEVQAVANGEIVYAAWRVGKEWQEVDD